MKEKVMYVKLPEGAKYRKVIVTEDGSIGIIYSEECKCQYKEEVAVAKVEIPKPKALVGGSEVYQKDDMLYWYCKIKNGRDEFMNIFMEDLTEEDLLYDPDTGEERKFSGESQENFKKDVLEALSNKPKEGFRWIPVFEPSLSHDGGVQFIKGEKPLVNRYSPLEWKKIFEEYSTENESGFSSDTTYFLLLLRWLKDGVATLEQLADNSKEIGHYWKSKNKLKRTGKREFGGLYGFVGNTGKIVESQNLSKGYLMMGYNFGSVNDLAKVSIWTHCSPDLRITNCVGLLELKK